MENTIGIDMGLKAFLSTNEGEEVAIPQFYRQSQKKLKLAQRSLSHKTKGSNRHTACRGARPCASNRHTACKGARPCAPTEEQLRL